MEAARTITARPVHHTFRRESTAPGEGHKLLEDDPATHLLSRRHWVLHAHAAFPILKVPQPMPALSLLKGRPAPMPTCSPIRARRFVTSSRVNWSASKRIGATASPPSAHI